jgi:alpha/beta superfamily hydrolase
MPEEKTIIRENNVRIEGLINVTPGDKAVVITHPHPLYGGEMHNNVVQAIKNAYSTNAFSTLRFNFRGVGESTGEYSEGVGEQEDVHVALSYMKELGKSEIHLAGYSFGAWVNAMGLTRFKEASRLVMVSPPVNFMDFSFLKYDSRIKLVVAGSNDEIASPELIKNMISSWNPEAIYREIIGADHFYNGKTKDIEEIIDEFLSNIMSKK